MALDFKQVDADLVPFRRRLLFVFFLVIVLFCVLIGRFAWLQIINKNAYTERAEKNRTVTVVSQAARGLIYDRNGELLAKNTLAYSLEITPDKVSDLEKTIDALSEIIPITTADRRRFVRLREDLNRYDSIPIRQELTDTGYLRRQAKARDRGRRVSSKPMEFRSSAGLPIFVGRSNRQNDRLTTRTAEKWDLWFHTQKIHGSHVILSTGGGRPDAQSIAEAASLAAYFSQAQSSTKVPVDFTQVKFVKKPAAAKPGMVIYTNYQTVLADPNEELVKHLLVK